MIANIYNKLTPLAKISNIFYAILTQTLVQILMVLVFIPRLGQYSTENIFDLRMYYNGEDISRFLTTLGESGRQLYFFNELIDLVYPFAYTAAFVLLFIYLGQKAFKSQALVKIALILPLSLFLSDYLENCSILTMLMMFPIRNGLYHITGYVTLIKQVLLGLNIFSITGFAFIAIKKQFLG